MSDTVSQAGSIFSGKSTNSFYKTGFNHLKTLEEIASPTKPLIPNYKVSFSKGYNLSPDYEEIKIQKKNEKEAQFNFLKDDGRGAINFSNKVITQLIYDQENPTKVFNRDLSNDIWDTKELLTGLSFEDQFLYFQLNKEQRFEFIKKKKLQQQRQSSGDDEASTSPSSLPPPLSDQAIRLTTATLPAYQSIVQKFKASLEQAADPKATSSRKHLLMVLGKHLRANDPTLISLNLSNLQLNDQHAKILSLNLKYHKFLRFLNLYNNQLTDEGLRSVFYALLEQKTINSLSLGKNRISNGGVRSICEILLLNEDGSSLETLNLGCKRVSNLEHTIKVRQVLWNLHSFREKFDEKKFQNYLLEDVTEDKEDEEDKKDDDDDDDEGEPSSTSSPPPLESSVVALSTPQPLPSSSPSSSYLPSEELILSHLFESQSTLQDDRYEISPYLTSEISPLLARVLYSDLNSIKSLNLSGQKFYNFGNFLIFQSIRQQKNFSSLISLDLSFNSLTDESIFVIFKTFLNINMTQNEYFYFFSKINEKFTKNEIENLILDQKNQKNNFPLLENLNLSGNFITSKGAILLAHAASMTPNLRTLDLSHCLIDEVGIVALHSSIFWNHSLYAEEPLEGDEDPRCLYDDLSIWERRTRVKFGAGDTRVCSCCRGLGGIQSIRTEGNINIFCYLEKEEAAPETTVTSPLLSTPSAGPSSSSPPAQAEVIDPGLFESLSLSKFLTPSLLNFFNQVHSTDPPTDPSAHPSSAFDPLASSLAPIEEEPSLPPIPGAGPSPQDSENTIANILQELEGYEGNPFLFSHPHQYVYFLNLVNFLYEKQEKKIKQSKNNQLILKPSLQNSKNPIENLKSFSSLSLTDRITSQIISTTIPEGLNQIRAYETTPLTDHNLYLLYLKTLKPDLSETNKIEYVSFVSSYWEQERQREHLAILRRSEKFKKLKKHTMLLRALKAKEEKKAAITRVPESFYSDWRIKMGQMYPRGIDCASAVKSTKLQNLELPMLRLTEEAQAQVKLHTITDGKLGELPIDLHYLKQQRINILRYNQHKKKRQEGEGSNLQDLPTPAQVLADRRKFKILNSL